MGLFNWGDLQIGRIPLRETFVATESGGGDGRSLDLDGQESSPPLTRAQVIARPRWGCLPTNYLTGRVRVTTAAAQEVYGVDVPLAATGWSLTNGLINVTWSATGGGTLDVQSYTGGAYRSKPWAVYGSSTLQ